MIQEYYDLLGVNEYSTDEEINERYRELKKKYNEERWLDGEAGNEAAKMLNKLDTAYQEIKNYRREKERNESGVSAFDEVEKLIKDGKIQEAQNKLDEFDERNARWHYLQAAVFYRKQWTNECKKQLEIAMNLDPSNEKYKKEYEKFNTKTEQNEQAKQAQENNNGTYRYDAYGAGNDPEQMGGSGCSECLNSCATCLCFNMLLNICCNCR